MRKTFVITLLAILLVSLSGCQLTKIDGWVPLNHKSVKTSEELYNNLCNKYNINNTNYYVISNYEDYVQFCVSVNHVEMDLTNEEDARKYFKKNVKIVIPRIEEGYNAEVSVGYNFDGYSNNIFYFYGYYDPENAKVDRVCYYFDLVNLSNRLYKRLNNKS